MNSQDVQSQGAAINLANWAVYADSNDKLTAKLVAEICEEIRNIDGFFITRGYVRQAFSQSFNKGVISSVIWGYPKGRFPGGKLFAGIFAKTEVLANKLEKLKTGKPLLAKDVCAEFADFNGLGPSTYTKMIYFAEIVAVEGSCLIYDQMVMRAITEADEPQWSVIKTKLGSCRDLNGKFKLYPPKLQVETYSNYLLAIHSLATGEKNAEAIELDLFKRAPRGRPTPHKRA